MPTIRINAKYESAQARKHRIDETPAEAADTIKDYVDPWRTSQYAPLNLNPWMIGGNDRRVNSENAS